MAATIARTLLKVERKAAGVSLLTFTNPKHLNCMSVEAGKQFEAAINELAGDPSLRALVLTGDGRAFSAGGDLDFLHARSKTPTSVNSESMRAFYGRFLSIRRLPVPTIAAINGPAVGAGMALAAACDIRVAAAGATLGFNFVKIGIPPGMGSSFLLAKATNPQVAARLLLTGDLIKSEEAARLGLVLSVHPQEAVVDEALRIATSIATASPTAVRSTTKTLRMHENDGLDAALQLEADAQAIAFTSADFEHGLTGVKDHKQAVFPDAPPYEK